MLSFVAAAGIAAAVSAAATPIVRHFAPRFGAVDLPSGRRVNKRVIPRLGGLAILLGFLAPLLGLFLYDSVVGLAFRADLSRALGLTIGAAMMAALGALDDVRGMRAWKKFLIQALIAGFAFAAGFRIEEIRLPWIGALDMGVFALPVTVLWIVGLVNAVNLIDGLDGLAAGVAFFACVVNVVVGVVSGSVLVTLISAALGGALLGFLIYNFNPATIFMGDSGSMFIGYVLATAALLGNAAKASTAVSLLVPVLAMGVPIMDTLFAIVRRYLERRSIFSPDRGHLHHRLLDLGLTHRRAVLLLYGASLIFTVAAVAVYVGRSWQIAAALGASALAVFGLVRGMGLFQHRIVRRQQREGDLSNHADLFRHTLPVLFRDVVAAADGSAVVTALKAFAATTRLVYVECSAPEIPALGTWTWEGTDANGKGNGGGSRPNGRGYVSATFFIQVGDKPAGTIKFGWHSEHGDVSPQSDTLLQVVVDTVEKRLADLSGAPWPNLVAAPPLDRRSRPRLPAQRD